MDVIFHFRNVDSFFQVNMISTMTVTSACIHISKIIGICLKLL